MVDDAEADLIRHPATAERMRGVHPGRLREAQELPDTAALGDLPDRRVGSKRKRAKRRLDLQHRFNLKGKRILEAPVRHDRRLFVAVRRHRVRYLAMVDPAALRSLGAIRRALRRTD